MVTFSQDLDDALHIKKLSEGAVHGPGSSCAPWIVVFCADKYEVGVHIADVSYFVKPNTALDEVASRRATSTYLVHKVCTDL